MIKERIKGLVFDMDNTLLKSNINFIAMKSDVYAFLTGHRVISPDTRVDEHTTATLIEMARLSDLFDEDMSRTVWHIVRDHEMKGMSDAKLQPHVEEVLGMLSKYYYLTVLTNNAYDAAESALGRNGIFHLFNLVVGREQVPNLKPSPAGVLHILNMYPALAKENWLCTGDSWIDGRAALDAGLSFISYRGDIAKMNEKGIYPLLNIQDMTRLLDILL